MNRLIRLVFLVAAFLLLLAGCASSGSSVPVVLPPGPSAPAAVPASQPAPPPAATPGSPAASPPSAHSPGTRYPPSWKLPDRKLSPGAVQPGYGIGDICPHVNQALEAMRPSTSDKAKVYAAYGITHHATGQYEVDHIIPIELLGLADAPAGDPAENLYPEVNDTPDPAAVAREHLNPAFVENSKDILEDVLHRDVCDGQVPLATAQHAIASDWRAAYVRYVGQPPRQAPPRVRPQKHPAVVASLAPVHAVTAPPATHRAVAATSHAAAPVHAACYPRTNGGNCYRAGEFCRKSDLGTTGAAGNGERIKCAADGSRNRWEPA